MIRYGHYIPTQKEYEEYTSLKPTIIQRIVGTIFPLVWHTKWKMYKKMQEEGVEKDDCLG
jgi:hypothetical protein